MTDAADGLYRDKHGGGEHVEQASEQVAVVGGISRLRRHSAGRCHRGGHALQRGQVAVERPAALGRQPVPGHRLAFDEGAAQRDVAVVLEPAQLRAEVAVGQRELLLQPREADLAVAGQQYAHRQADAVLEHRVETVEDVHRYAAAAGCRRLAMPAHTRASAIMAPATVHRWGGARSAEHTSELQSLMRNSYAVFCLTKKNKYQKHIKNATYDV